MQPDEEPLFPKNLTNPGGRPDMDPTIDWGDDVAAPRERSQLDDIKSELRSMFAGKSPGEIFAETRTWLEARPMTTTVIGFGLGFALGRLMRRS